MATQGRRPTIVDIAKKANVSFKTVSRVLNEHPRVAADLRERVLKAMAELDYQPNLAARSLAGRRGYAVALLIDRTELFSGDDTNASFPPYLVDLQAGALSACRETGYHFFIEPYDPRSRAFPNDLRAQLSKIALDGVLLAPPTADRSELMDALDDWGIPYVRIAPGIEHDRSPSVSVDEYRGTVAMAEHLLSLGHRRIGFVGGPESHIAAAVRLVAFRETVKGRAEVVTHSGDFTFAAGFAAGEVLLSLTDRPSAIFAANDFMASGVIAAATHLGLRVPLDVSIAGFDDSAAAHFTWPPLTTVRQPIREMAYQAIKYLITGTRDKESGHLCTELSVQLVIRKSTGPAPI